jgi:hypothetical protein
MILNINRYSIPENNYETDVDILYFNDFFRFINRIFDER